MFIFMELPGGCSVLPSNRFEKRRPWLQIKMPNETEHSSPSRRDGGVLDPWSLIYFFQDHAFVLTLSTLLGLTLSVAYLWWAPRVYSSRAVLEVASDDRPFGEPNRQAASDAASASLLKTVEQTIASPAVLGRVITANQLADDPAFGANSLPMTKVISLLDERVSVNLIRGTRLIAVEVEDPSPAQAQKLTRSLLDEFFSQSMENRRSESVAAREFLQAEVKRTGDKLKDSEQRLQRYREQYDAMALADRQNLVIDRLRHLTEQVSAARNTRMALEAEKDQVTAALNSNNPAELLNLNRIAERTEVIDLRKQLDANASTIAQYAERYRDKHPLMLQARRQQEEIKVLLNNAVRSVAESLLRAYQAAQATEESLQQELARQQQAAIELDRVAIDYRNLEREVQSDAALYQQLLARDKETDVTRNFIAEQKFSGGRIQVVGAPLMPSDPIRPVWKLVLAAGLLGGGALGTGIALLRRAFDNSVPSVDVAEALLGVNTLVVVPQSKRLRFRRGKASLLQPGSPDAEMFRSLRTTMALRQEAGGPRAMMFTSALPGEGKSFCASNYAMVVAHSGQRTLLIDGDLRRPVLRYAFGRCTEKPGLTECLKDPARFGAVIDDTPIKNLYLLGNSFGTPHSAELLANGNLPRILELGLAQFDRVIIDTAPVAVVSDALYFARHVPAICLVVLAARTPRRIVRRVCSQLQEVAGQSLIGVVLNQIRRDHNAGHHYYYYGVESRPGGLNSARAIG
jgi:succinoglycan biosynthesis transport protein ExoP